MTRHVAFLRGVSPTNARMPELKAAFEQAGFGAVRTVLASGNVVFDASGASEAVLEQRAERAMQAALGRSFMTLVRPVEMLQELLRSDPFPGFGVPPEAKRVVSFLRDAREPRVPLPLARDHACVLALRGREAFTAYVPGEQGPVFMALIEAAFGRDVTTRTWETIARCAAA